MLELRYLGGGKYAEVKAIEMESELLNAVEAKALALELLEIARELLEVEE